jgi:hypothetical protein
MQCKTGRPVQFEVSEQTREAIGRWLENKDLPKGEQLFQSCVIPDSLHKLRNVSQTFRHDDAEPRQVPRQQCRWPSRRVHRLRARFLAPCLILQYPQKWPNSSLEHEYNCASPVTTSFGPETLTPLCGLNTLFWTL